MKEAAVNLNIHGITLQLRVCGNQRGSEQAGKAGPAIMTRRAGIYS